MSDLNAKQVYEMGSGETRLVSVDYRGKLDTGELLTGTPTVTISPSGPTISNEAVNTAALTIAGETVAIGQAVQFKITGVTAGTTYTITTKCGTDSTPAQLALECRLTLVGV